VPGEEIDSLDRLAEQLSDINSGDDVVFLVFVSEQHGGYTLKQTGKVTLKAR
jgi:hypothetical protein